MNSIYQALDKLLLKKDQPEQKEQEDVEMKEINI